MFKISREERKIQFLYLLALWIVISILFCFVCFFKSPKTEVRAQEIVIEKISDENKILRGQLDSQKDIDSLGNMLAHYDPATSQVILESNIDYELSTLKMIADAKKADPRYKVFLQLYELNYMQFNDKKEIWNSVARFNALEKKLADCNDGIQKKQDRLNVKEAISSQDK